MMRIGVIGMGFMGGVHLNAWQQLNAVTVCAVCDANPVFGNAKPGNVSSGSGELDLDGIAIYTDVADMLSAETLDAVSITLPTHLHQAVSIQCLEAGVHVLCEKPMALSEEDCAAMIAAADQAGKELMVAHCIRFWPVYGWLKQAVEAGRYGAVRSADFERLTFAPAWGVNSWFSDPAKSGGIALDLHIHDLDFIQHLFGEPGAIRSKHLNLDNGQPGYIQSWLDYGEAPSVTATASWLMPESYGFRMAYTVVFDQAAAVFDGQTLRLYPSDGICQEPELEPGDGYLHQIVYFADLIQHRIETKRITAEQAAISVRMALEAAQS